MEYALMVGGFTFLVGIILAVYFWRREKKLGLEIQKMLDYAIAGKYREVRLDESKASEIENNMWRYLCDKEVFEQKLKDENRRLQMQISDISHQAVLPISNIILYSQLVEEWLESEEFEEKPVIEEEIEAIREQAEVLDFLMEGLVKISRMETGIIHVNARQQPFGPLLEIIKRQFQEKANKKGIRFLMEGTEEEAVFDLKWTTEAVANVVDNAIKYTNEGGWVGIHIESYPSFVRMDVTDNGIGILETEQATVFNRFFRSEAVKNEPGVGIGLYLAREVMKAQNGYIKVASKIGEGSCFSLFFLKEEISQN